MAIVDLQKNCLAGVLSAWETQDIARVRLQKITAELSEQHFQGEYYRVWQMLSYYGYVIDGVPAPSRFKEAIDNARNLAVPEKVRLNEHFASLASIDVSDIDFSISIVRLKEQQESDKMDEILRTAVAIQNGIYTHKGKELSGYQDSKEYLLEQLPSADGPMLDVTSRLEGDINTLEDANAIIDSYRRAQTEDSYGITTGLADLDLHIGGLSKGDIMLIAGFTSVGKSKVAQNIAYHVCYNLGKNVVFGTNEVTREQVHRTMVVRHSHNDVFQGKNPLRYLDVKRGHLEQYDEEFLREVVVDMQKPVDDSGNRRYGRMYIFQMPSRSTVDYVRNVLQRVKRNFDVDLVVIDYLGLMSSQGRRDSRREELDDLLVGAKRLAVEVQVPIVSPWQISRMAWNEARDKQRNNSRDLYTRASLSDTSQAEKTSDIIISLFKPNDADGGYDSSRNNVLRCQVLKNRDGEVGGDFDLTTDFATGMVRSEQVYDDRDGDF